MSAQDTDLFVALAEIAGVFVGFGALISLTQSKAMGLAQIGQMRHVVVVGLVVMVAALLPIAIARFGVTDPRLWFSSSLVFVVLIWVAVLLPMRTPDTRGPRLAQMRANPVQNAVGLALATPIQLSLFAILLGPFPDLNPALYLLALITSLFEAAFVLVQLVFSGTQSTSK